MSTTLADVPIGSAVVIDHLASTGREKALFLEMGLLPGVRVTVERIGPGGEPIQLRFRRRRMSLSREEAAGIHVQAAGR